MFNVKKIIVALTLCASSSIPSMAHATGIPGTDYAFLGNMIIENITAIYRHQEKKAMNELGMGQSGDISELEIENQNNEWANLTIRSNQQDQEIQNIKVMQDFEPGTDACETVAVSQMLNKDICNLEQKVADMGAKSADGIFVNVKESEKHLSSEKRLTLRKIEILNRAKAKRPDLLDDSLSAEEKEAVAQTIDTTNYISTNPMMLMSSSPYMLTLTEEEKNTLIDFAFLVSPPPAMSNVGESLYDVSDEAKVDFAVKQAFASVPSNTFHQLISLRTAISDDDGAPSVLEIMQKFSDLNYATGGEATDSIMHKASTSELATPASIARNNLVLAAYRAYLKTEKFKRSLDTELNYAVLLSKKINK